MQSIQHKIPSFLLTLRQMLDVKLFHYFHRMIIKKVLYGGILEDSL